MGFIFVNLSISSKTLPLYLLGLHFFSTHNNFVVSAAATIANIVKSSLGPVGLDKMLVDDVGVNIFKTCPLVCCFKLYV